MFNEFYEVYIIIHETTTSYCLEMNGKAINDEMDSLESNRT